MGIDDLLEKIDENKTEDNGKELDKKNAEIVQNESTEDSSMPIGDEFKAYCEAHTKKK